MGRAGGGGFSGGHSGGFSSGGGHTSSSHSGGGHRSSPSGGSSRAGSRSYSGSSSSSRRTSTPSFGSYGSFGSRRSFSPVIINNGGGGMGSGRARFSNGGCTGCLTVAIIIFVILILIVAISSSFGGGGSGDYSRGIPASSYNREKLTGTSWDNDCVVDEIGWISEDGSVSGLERQLREFYDKTGVQPYVYFVGYRPELFTEANKADFASDYYENEIANDYTFAFFYFEEENPDDVGYMHYEGGSRALGVMDSEAVEIFWAITDSEWYNFDQSTEDCMANIFIRTADRIMTKSATTADITKIVLIIVLVIVIAAVIIIIMNKRRKQEKERNEETRRILETPLE